MRIERLFKLSFFLLPLPLLGMSYLQKEFQINCQDMILASSKDNNFRVTQELPLIDSKTKSFIKAASGLRFYDNPELNAEKALDQKIHLLVAQDSSRYLGIARFNNVTFREQINKFRKFLSPLITFIPLDTIENIKTLEDPDKDYESHRKKLKKDYEAMTTLPNGHLLIIGSGSDISKIHTQKKLFRTSAILLNPMDMSYKEYMLKNFYDYLNSNKKVVGMANNHGEPRLNIEGIGVHKENGEFYISFFHRSNTNKNYHDTIIQYKLNDWLLYVKKNSSIAFRLKYHKIYRLKFPSVQMTSGKKNVTLPISLHDALFGENKLIIPVSAEKDSLDGNGNYVDGHVVFSGIAYIKFSGKNPECTIYQSPNDKDPGLVSDFGKIEGIAAFTAKGRNAYERSLLTEESFVIGIHDVDSEHQPSTMSVLDIKSLLKN